MPAKTDTITDENIQQFFARMNAALQRGWTVQSMFVRYRPAWFGWRWVPIYYAVLVCDQTVPPAIDPHSLVEEIERRVDALRKMV